MVYCEAIIEDEALRENIIQCIKILEGEPIVVANKVSISTTKNVGKLVELFEHLSPHLIRVSPS